MRNTLPLPGISPSLLQKRTRFLCHGAVNFRAIGDRKIERDQSRADGGFRSCRRFFGLGRECFILFESLSTAAARQQHRTGGCARVFAILALRFRHFQIKHERVIRSLGVFEATGLEIFRRECNRGVFRLCRGFVEKRLRSVEILLRKGKDRECIRCRPRKFAVPKIFQHFLEVRPGGTVLTKLAIAFA